MAHRASLVLAAGICAAACSLGPNARADEVRTIAPTAPESPGRPDPMLGLTGAVMFAVPYGLSVYSAAASDVTSDRWMYLPVAGPFADLIARQTCQTEGCKGDPGPAALPLAIDGLAQAAGVAILITTFASPGVPPTSAYAGVHVVPTGYAGGAGVTAFGAF